MLNYASAGLISRPGRELWSVPRKRGALHGLRPPTGCPAAGRPPAHSHRNPPGRSESHVIYGTAN